MQFSEYQTAAEKHLKACKAILNMLATENFNKLLRDKDRNLLLMDIYYLSGYIFECVITYGIYKKAFDFHQIEFETVITENIKNKNIFGNGGAYYHNPPNIYFAFYPKYNPKLHLSLSQTPLHSTNYCVNGHKFWKNIELLHLILSGNTIPLISNYDDTSLNPEILELYRLVRDWEPEKRYLIEDPPFTIAQITNLLNLAEKVYLGVIKNI
ncbi:MAG: hypothetical protein EAZ85_11645 [Bacteroidetes bacterium]|nr:MAG: hypothetical protein EAZ85_11645 [Bacteroidota bacterium]TAG89244.1 MAG: hypothetical protein EAZ20_06925 [Bacteroidota bacterium]